MNMLKMTQVGKLAVGALAVLVFLGVGQTAMAVNLNKTCKDAGGTCKDGCSANESYASSKLGCVQASCCIPKGSTCADQGGICSGGCGGETTNATQKFDCIEDCCVPKNSAAASKSGSTGSTGSGGSADSGSTQAPAPPMGGIPQLACEATGDCSVDSIVQKGVSFAQFIMGLSGAVFLLVFIYGGGLYILSFGKSSWVDKGKKAMVQACIGMVLVMGAWTIVWYVAKSLGFTAPSISSQTGGSKGVCGAALGTEGGKCMDINKEGKGKSCTPGYCTGPTNIQCCK